MKYYIIIGKSLTKPDVVTKVLALAHDINNELEFFLVDNAHVEPTLVEVSEVTLEVFQDSIDACPYIDIYLPTKHPKYIPDDMEYLSKGIYLSPTHPETVWLDPKKMLTEYGEEPAQEMIDALLINVNASYESQGIKMIAIG